MQVVILAGGRGTRLDHDKPKPMVEIGGIPMLSHIMGIYRKYGYNEFVIATGYKGDIIRDYYGGHSNIICLDTGEDSEPGERVKLCADYLRAEDEFMLTYGDGVSNIDIGKLVAFHSGLVTITAVHPGARFGQLIIHGDKVVQFNEKPVDQTEWINGGFFVVNTKFARMYAGKTWAYDALPRAAMHGQLRAYRHEGFWQCMDTQRDVDYLNQLWKEGAPWL